MLYTGLPDHLKVSNPADLAPIRSLTEVTCAFFELNTLMHYMRLGMHISEKKVFSFGENPYYFFATCDFSDLLLWVFDRASGFFVPCRSIKRERSSEFVFRKGA